MNDNDETTTPEKEPETHYGVKSAGQKRGNIMHDKSDILKHGWEFDSWVRKQNWN